MGRRKRRRTKGKMYTMDGGYNKDVVVISEFL